MKRGRRSAEDSSTVIIGAFGERPKPPAELNERQATIWRNIVAAEPMDFFRTAANQGILADLCRHRDSAAQIADVINSFEAAWLRSEEGSKRYAQLLRMRELETRASLSCATKLRLTNQSRYTPQAAGTAARNNVIGTKPWDAR